MKVIYRANNDAYEATDLTDGRVYDVICIMGDDYLITDDNDDDYPYPKMAFEVVEEMAVA